jgi:DNA helicase-2/ATP-dependent DNA helicase PcrA
MLDFTYHYKQAKIIVLENNYRSHQYILDTASELIKNNNERLINKINTLEKKLIAKSNFENPETPKFYSAYNEIDEQNYVYENIKNLLSKGIKINEIALIVRQNKEVEIWSEFLKSQGIEVESKQKTNILNSDIIHLVLDYLLLIANPYADDRKFIDLLLSSCIDVENIDVITLARYLNSKNYVRKDKIALFDIVKNESLLQEVELESREKIRVFSQKLLEFKSYLSQKTFIAFFEYFLQESQLLDYLDMYGTFNDLQDIFTLFNKIKDFSSSNPYISLETFLHKMNLYKTYRFPILRENLKTSTH